MLHGVAPGLFLGGTKAREILQGKINTLLKTNMSPENLWLEDVILNLSLFRACQFFGGVNSVDILVTSLLRELWRVRDCPFNGQCIPSNLWIIRDTPPKFNMEPEKKSLEKEVPLGNHHFQVPC